MLEEKWEQLVEMAKKHFSNVSLETEEIIFQSEDGPEHRGTKDILTFSNGSGRFRLVKENKPAVLGKTEHFSHRMGDTARTEYKLSATEMTHKLRVYKEVAFDDWDEITLDSLGL